MIRFLLAVAITIITFRLIKRYLGVTVERVVWYLLCIGCLIGCLIKGSWLLAGVMLISLLLAKKMHTDQDNILITKYKAVILELHKLIDSGWGQVYKANELRTMAYNVWLQLPKNKQKAIHEWELSLENKS
jgi:hypothetical protein